MSQDRIFALPLDQVGDFRFDKQVVDVFPDMIGRSVPGYASVLAMTAELAARFAKPETNVYDLGCSLGAASFAMQSRIDRTCTIHAVDASGAMASALRERVAERGMMPRIKVREANILDEDIQSASFAVLNYTLQFIPPDRRLTCLARVAKGLETGGALVLSEKVCFEDEAVQEQMTELHHAFKSAHGYSDLEIAQKRTSLEKTLITETVEVHRCRLLQAGFSQATVWFQCLNFVSMLAVK